METLKAVLFSRHELVPKALKYLKQKGIEIVTQVPYVRDADSALRIMAEYNADVAIVIIPYSIIFQMQEKAPDIIYIQPYSQVLHKLPCSYDCKFNPETDWFHAGQHYRFITFKKVKINIVLEDF